MDFSAYENEIADLQRKINALQEEINGLNKFSTNVNETDAKVETDRKQRISILKGLEQFDKRMKLAKQFREKVSDSLENSFINKQTSAFVSVRDSIASAKAAVNSEIVNCRNRIANIRNQIETMRRQEEERIRQEEQAKQEANRMLAAK